jgi:hypothetical protein
MKPHPIIIGILLAVRSAFAIDAPDLARELDGIARVASTMVDGDVCERILTRGASESLLKEDPRDKWAASDNFDVNHDAYIQTKKVLIRLGKLGTRATDVNLWMPVGQDRVQILIRNANEISQFWKWGDLHQPMPVEMKRVLATGKREIVTTKPGFVSVLAPVINSLGDKVGLVEVVTQIKPDPHGNVK